MNLNPYESPRVEPSQAPPPPDDPLLDLHRAAKRNMGLAVIFLMTPPAVAIASFTCCTFDQNIPYYDRSPFIYLAFTIGVPLLVLVGLLSAAGYVRAKWSTGSYRSSTFYGILWATPICLIVGIAAGVGLTALLYWDLSRPGGMLKVPVWTLYFALFGPPTLTLVLMLAVAWRNR